MKYINIINIILSFLKGNYLFICLLSTFLWLACVFNPGSVTNDTFYIYSDAYHNSIGNWHSALLARFWQCILFFTDMRGIFMLIQLAPLCLGLYIIGKNLSKGIITGIICVFLLFITPVFSYVAVVLKDTYLATFTFLISALMLDAAIADKKKTFTFCIISGIVLAFCCYVRANGCFIAVPLLVAICIGWKAPIFYRYIVSFLLVLFIVATTSFVELKLLKARDQAPDFSLMLFDIIGTAKNTGKSNLPVIPEIPDQMAIVNQCYTPLQWDTISHWKREPICSSIAIHYFEKVYQGKKNRNQARSELRNTWITAIVNHPLAYLKHRISHFNRFINYQGHRPVFQPISTTDVGFINHFDKNDALNYEIRAPKIWVNFITKRESSLTHELWFHPYVSLLILLFFYLSTLATVDRFNRTLNVVAFSGFIYLMGFLFVGVSSNFRYSYPSLLLSILCILAAFAFYSQKRKIFGTRKTRIIAASVTVPLFLIGVIL